MIKCSKRFNTNIFRAVRTSGFLESEHFSAKVRLLVVCRRQQTQHGGLHANVTAWAARMVQTRLVTFHLYVFYLPTFPYRNKGWPSWGFSNRPSRYKVGPAHEPVSWTEVHEMISDHYLQRMVFWLTSTMQTRLETTQLTIALLAEQSIPSSHLKCSPYLWLILYTYKTLSLVYSEQTTVSSELWNN